MVTCHVRQTQVFQSNDIVALDQAMRQLVAVILAPLSDTLVLCLELTDRLPAIASPLHPARHAPLNNAQLLLFCPIPPGVLDTRAVTHGEQGRDPHVHAHGLSRRRQWCTQRRFDSKGCVPLPRLLDDPHPLDGPFNGPVPRTAMRPIPESFSRRPSTLKPFPVSFRPKPAKRLRPLKRG